MTKKTPLFALNLFPDWRCFFLQYGCRKIPQINKVCVDFLFLFNKKMGFLSREKRKKASPKGSYNTTEVVLLVKKSTNRSKIGFVVQLFCSTTQLKRCNSEMCCRKCTGRSSGNHANSTAARPHRWRWILICAGLWQREGLHRLALKCHSVAGWWRLPKRVDGQKWPTGTRRRQISIAQEKNVSKGVMAVLWSPGISRSNSAQSQIHHAFSSTFK